MDKLCIIIPAYNEEKRISKTLEEFGNFFLNLKKEGKLETEIIVVINNTKDRTEEIVKQQKKKFKSITYLNFKRGGKGFAIIEGFKHALKMKNVGLIGFVDADLATSPEAFYDLVLNIKDYDGVIASRYLPESRVNPKQTFNRILVSRIFNLLIRALLFLPYKDTQCGAKVFKRKAIEAIIDKIAVTEWAFDVDLLYQMKKAKENIKEYPTVWADKEYSKINFMNAGPKMALSVIKLRFKNIWV